MSHTAPQITYETNSHKSESGPQKCYLCQDRTTTEQNLNLSEHPQVQQSAAMQPSLRGLKACTNLRWNDFSVQTKSSVKAGKRIFYPAVWNSSQGPVNVTLMMYKEQMASQMVCQQSVQPQTLSLNAITEFCDLVPLQQFGEDGEDLVQGTRCSVDS